jgi:CubicO group peptidase (beta-lactamase class C family)
MEPARGDDAVSGAAVSPWFAVWVFEPRVRLPGARHRAAVGDPWDAYVQKNIFAPLGIQHSYFRNTPYYLAAHRSHNYTIVRDSATRSPRLVDQGADFDPGITTPNGGWNAPIGDLAIYTAFLTNTVPPGGSRTNYDVVLSRASLARCGARGSYVGWL